MPSPAPCFKFDPSTCLFFTIPIGNWFESLLKYSTRVVFYHFVVVCMLVMRTAEKTSPYAQYIYFFIFFGQTFIIYILFVLQTVFVSIFISLKTSFIGIKTGLKSGKDQSGSDLYRKPNGSWYWNNGSTDPIKFNLKVKTRMTTFHTRTQIIS